MIRRAVLMLALTIASCGPSGPPPSLPQSLGGSDAMVGRDPIVVVGQEVVAFYRNPQPNQPAAAARAIAELEWLADTLPNNPRWMTASDVGINSLIESRWTARRALGIPQNAPAQAVINGRTHVNGAHEAEVSGALAKLGQSGAGMTVGISVTRSGGSVIIDTEGAPGGVGDAHLVLVYFDPMRPIVIQHGENQGRTIDYVNPVSDIQTAGMWHGKPARYELPQSEIAKKGGCAVLLQKVSKDGLPGAILGAAVIQPGEN